MIALAIGGPSPPHTTVQILYLNSSFEFSVGPYLHGKQFVNPQHNNMCIQENAECLQQNMKKPTASYCSPSELSKQVANMQWPPGCNRPFFA